MTELHTRFENVAVVGAAGKMGSGISLLLALELAWRALERPEATFILNLVDVNDGALQDLVRYIRAQAVKDAEKQINRLRVLFRDRAELVDNQDMVQEFAFEVLLRLRTGRTLALAKDAWLVFEAAFESEPVKVGIYRELAGLCRPETCFLTNTSSLPIQALSEACGVPGRMIGFHFYNPPAVQKLVEVIRPAGCTQDLADLAAGIAQALRKRTVPAADVAGFIGNGHFIRDGLYALRLAERLAERHGFVPAVHLVERVSRDFLLRPMGIFQLIDYVGIDVFQLITRVMARHLGGDLGSPLVDRYLDLGVKGGQGSGGAQKPGFLTYEKGRPAGIYDPDTGGYVALDDPGIREAEALLGPHPDPGLSWKALQKDPARAAKLAAYFQVLASLDTLGGRLAREHLLNSRAIGLELVRQGVARSPEDVNEVLKLGFFHLYGPINDYLEAAP